MAAKVASIEGLVWRLALEGHSHRPWSKSWFPFLFSSFAIVRVCWCCCFLVIRVDHGPPWNAPRFSRVCLICYRVCICKGVTLLEYSVRQQPDTLSLYSLMLYRVIQVYVHQRYADENVTSTLYLISLLTLSWFWIILYNYTQLPYVGDDEKPRDMAGTQNIRGKWTGTTNLSVEFGMAAVNVQPTPRMHTTHSPTHTFTALHSYEWTLTVFHYRAS